MSRAPLVLAAIVIAAGCSETDTEYRGGEVAPDQELEGSGVEVTVEPVDFDTLTWFTEGRTVEFQGRTYIVAGNPVYDPAVERVGEFEGTPLYAEPGVASPPQRLYIPLENDYWQMLEAGAAGPGPGSEDTLTRLR